MLFIRFIVLSLLCLQLVLPASIMQGILKFPALISHYLEHYSQEHTHFGQFIQQHYTAHAHHENEDEEHDNLPFHHHDTGLQQVSFTYTLPPLIVTETPAARLITPKKIVARQHFFPSVCLSSVWRPPKFA